ncbi:lycopene cyclase domain-containing protein [Tenggerimyces flavus]|uniref:Lycopene cyclase domain-containing protein n=1 Tax=Tenggerimyces flavus TaxID=1708749 RepID=A0ABV7YHR2_9ACTN|nr:lycopene cyclase domain-containing protein [Tenggerimyces flavus]MBM7783936.1 lycopene cyclase domain-containing protein [Tenggerimyces flavus]
MPEYTVAATGSILVVVLLELLLLRTRLFTKASYWITLAIVWFFQILVDGWLTKLDAPIVTYTREQFSGIRFPWDIPIEDFAFGFSIATLTLLLWEKAAIGRRPTASPRSAPERVE